MPVAKAISANDVIEGAPVVCPGGSNLANYTWDNPERVPHTSDPTNSTFSNIVSGRFLSQTWEESRPLMPAASGDVSVPSASGSEANITYAAVPYQQHAIFGVSWSYNAPTNGSGYLTVEAGSGNVVFSKQIPGTSAVEDEVLFSKGFHTTRGSAMIVRLTGVAGVKGQLSTLGHRME